MTLDEKIAKHRELNKILGFDAPLDKLMTSRGMYSVDIMKLDVMLGEKLADYDPMECLYKGELTSMKGAVLAVYGQRASYLLEELI